VQVVEKDGTPTRRCQLGAQVLGEGEIDRNLES
jgi:hypothetical protein